ncbi:ATP-binding protein [Simiduia sp. 21SJ11W-1]|uniref:hybrid sensor histidine kinase/response regulator n=1 Tax=Simiduia sp. 21SJ11W-1 TaxID=2909669 RepID=UPI0020A0315F|nr:ATP-binding protein [Simiduia sp. 21SJ11W-1]UTA46789.1 ATP-binding protein [Simiduia sp. 21SJ11W-1]
MIFSSLAFVYYDRYQTERLIANNISLLANLTGQRSSAALAFGDKKALQNNLMALETLPGFISACIYDRGHTIYSARLSNKSAFAFCPALNNNMTQPGYRQLHPTFLDVTAPIQRNKIDYGHILIRYSLAEAEQRTRVFAGAALLISLISISFSLIFSNRLQRMFVAPIFDLNWTAERVTHTQDYGIRAEQHSNDEVGNLVRSFNGMLDLIQDKHISLTEVVSELEKTSEDLKHYANAAEQKGEEFQQMLAGASHDLRQPLQAMAIFVDALKSTATQDQAPLVKKLDLAIDNMSQLFSSLLDYSRLQSKQSQNIEKSTVNLKDLINRVSHEFEAIANNKNLSMRFRLDNLAVLSHEVTIERILRNLLSNAIRYTNEGGVLIACRKRGEFISIDVYDTGIGIRPESMESIFQSYSQDNNRTEAHKQGVGLGLAIVLRLIKLLGFDLEVKSRVGRGSLFRIRIPVAVAPQATAAPDPVLSLPPDIALTQQQVLAGHKVCLLEDDPAIQQQLCSLLENWGAEVVAFGSLDELRRQLPALKAAPPQLILTDYQLDDVDTGLDAVDLIRLTCNSTLPALFVTGIEDTAELELLRAQGYSVLKKPVKPAKLRAMLSFMITHESDL